MKRRAFALLITMVLIILVSILTYSIVQSNIFSSNLNKLKYLHIQGQIHIDYIKNYILSHENNEINNVTLEDERYNLSIIKQDENNSTVYYISVETKDNTPIRLSNKIIK